MPSEMKTLEKVGFVCAIALAVYFYREVRQLKSQGSKDKDDQPETNAPSSVPVEGDGPLKRRQGFRVGHLQQIDVGNGQKLNLITKALRPLAFEVPNFLSDSEIEYLIDKAKKQNFQKSKAKSGLTEEYKYVKSEGKGKAQGNLGQFEFWDKDHDGFIDISEAKDAIQRYHIFVVPNDDDIRNMFLKICPKEFEDELITEPEWDAIDTINIEDQINFWYANDKRFASRYSEQTWLHWLDDKVLTNIRERVVKLTNLPREVVFGGEPIQIAHYYPGGHYHSHYDSETHLRNDLPGCHQQGDGSIGKAGGCILCRFITIMTYMNDVEEGGETAFPVADNSTFSFTDVRNEANLSTHCKDANLVITPKKGTAVFWYNHFVDAESLYLGDLDAQSLHGGCDVIKGEKWISNIWLPATYQKHKHIPSVYYGK